MRPCRKCGGVAVDAAGRCVACGTSRGRRASGHSPYLIPLIALSGVLALLVMAIVAVGVARGRAGTGSGTGASPTPGSLIDPCLVGTWRSVSDTQQLDVERVGPVTVSGQGTVVHVHPDGTELQDHAGATPYEGSAGGHQVRITITGTVRGTIRTSGGAITFAGLEPDGTAGVSVDGATSTSVPLTVNDDPVSYTCSGDTATERTSQYQVRLVRTSTSP